MLTIQMFDCTSFVFLLLARHSPQAAFGSQGKRFFTSFRMTKGLDSDAACGARLRACAGQGCGPHRRAVRHIDIHSLQNLLFCFLRCIPHSDCSLRLLRATATACRELWSTSVREAPTLLPPRFPPRIAAEASFGSRFTRRVPCTPAIGPMPAPCAASKHLHVKFAIRAVGIGDSAMLFIRKDPEYAESQSTDSSRYTPKEAPGRPSAQTFKGNQHPNQGNIPNGAHTRIVRTQKAQIHGNPRNIHPPRTAWTPRTRRATGTPPRTEGTRAVRNSTKKARTVTRSRYAEEAAPSAVRPAYFCSPRIRIAASRMAVSSNVTTPPSGPGSKWTPTHSLASCLPPK